MALSISDLTPEGRRYFEQLQKLSRLEVQVGFQEGQTYEDGTSLADVAAYNELGTSDSPARPFMRQSFENHEPELKAACEQVNKTLAEGEEKVLFGGRLGEYKYYDMDQVIAAVLDRCESELH